MPNLRHDLVVAKRCTKCEVDYGSHNACAGCAPKFQALRTVGFGLLVLAQHHRLSFTRNIGIFGDDAAELARAMWWPRRSRPISSTSDTELLARSMARGGKLENH